MEQSNNKEANIIHHEIRILREAARKRIEGIMGKGKVIRGVFDLVEQCAGQNYSLLLEGETGVGKKEIATYLHSISPRGGKDLVTIDCGTITKTLIESELFGCKKGAYTDAKTDRIGKIETANDSTLFLDNIHSLPLSAQDKLLQLIDEKEFTRVGESRSVKINVRIIAAGNANLRDSVRNGRFRRELYERFVERIKIPTLKERKEDLNFFIDKFIKEKANELGKKEVSIDEEAKKLLLNYTWEGNIRQLKHFIHRLIARVKREGKSKDYIISAELVKSCLAHELVIGNKIPSIITDFSWETALNKARKSALERALEHSFGNNEEAIALLGITRGTYYKWKKIISEL